MELNLFESRRLRREQTDEEKELWRALRVGRFAGFKFRRQHPPGAYHLDFFCPAARLSLELDGFLHGMPGQRERDVKREKFLSAWTRQLEPQNTLKTPKGSGMSHQALPPSR